MSSTLPPAAETEEAFETDSWELPEMGGDVDVPANDHRVPLPAPAPARPKPLGNIAQPPPLPRQRRPISTLELPGAPHVPSETRPAAPSSGKGWSRLDPNADAKRPLERSPQKPPEAPNAPAPNLRRPAQPGPGAPAAASAARNAPAARGSSTSRPITERPQGTAVPPPAGPVAVEPLVPIARAAPQSPTLIMPAVAVDPARARQETEAAWDIDPESTKVVAVPTSKAESASRESQASAVAAPAAAAALKAAAPAPPAKALEAPTVPPAPATSTSIETKTAPPAATGWLAPIIEPGTSLDDIERHEAAVLFEFDSDLLLNTGEQSPTLAGQSTGESICTFWLGPDCFGLDVQLVSEVLLVDDILPVPWAPPALLGLFNSRGRIVPVVSLAALLGLPAAPSEPLVVSQASPAILIKADSLVAAALIDRPGLVVQIERGSLTPTERGSAEPWVKGHLRPDQRSHPAVTLLDPECLVQRFLDMSRFPDIRTCFGSGGQRPARAPSAKNSGGEIS